MKDLIVITVLGLWLAFGFVGALIIDQNRNQTKIVKFCAFPIY